MLGHEYTVSLTVSKRGWGWMTKIQLWGHWALCHGSGSRTFKTIWIRINMHNNNFHCSLTWNFYTVMQNLFKLSFLPFYYFTIMPVSVYSKFKIKKVGQNNHRSKLACDTQHSLGYRVACPKFEHLPVKLKLQFLHGKNN